METSFFLKASIHASQILNKKKWEIERYSAVIHTIDQLSVKNTNVLLIGVQHELAEAQFFPFYFYKKELKSDLGLTFSEIPTLDWEACQATHENMKIKAVFFQCSFESSKEKIAENIRKIRKIFPLAKVIFMDWFAPLDIRCAEGIESLIDIYVKKQIYKDIENFLNPDMVDTNLSLYFSKRYNISDIGTVKFIQPSVIEKIRLGSNFGMSSKIYSLFLRSSPRKSNRNVDLHARMAVEGSPWYKNMRLEAFNAVSNLPKQISTLRFGRVSNYQFLAELHSSKMCFSPFGYGEVCWRDYEAIACGSLLIKPDVSHLTVNPNIFDAFVTYVPVKWDFSDFEQLLKHFLENPSKREDITQCSFNKMREWIVGAQFVSDVGAWIS